MSRDRTELGRRELLGRLGGAGVVAAAAWVAPAIIAETAAPAAAASGAGAPAPSPGQNGGGTAPGGGGTPGNGGTPGGSSGNPSSGETQQPSTQASPAGSTVEPEVLPVSVASPAAVTGSGSAPTGAGGEVGAASLPFTGDDVVREATVGAALIIGGAAAIGAARKPTRSPAPRGAPPAPSDGSPD
jgi:hypothetical protein